ncbi:hypothetical protein [Kordia sp.]|uniref:hypothetical protein n=1 Tax=Kordia sp. TaxID=1965332 RepID=UPI003B5C6F37
MKKKEFNSRLYLRKNVISNLQKNRLSGGTDGAVRTATYVIVTTIKITIDVYTKQREHCTDGSTKCTTIPPSCVETACFCPVTTDQ